MQSKGAAQQQQQQQRRRTGEERGRLPRRSEALLQRVGPRLQQQQQQVQAVLQGQQACATQRHRA
jgi:hypothetical protein